MDGEGGPLPSSEAEVQRLLYFLSRKVKKAVREFRLLEDGDRVLVAVSGGKDSLSLLLLLQALRRELPVRYDLHPVHVRLAEDAPCHPGDPSALAQWVAERTGLELLVVPMEPARGEPGRPGQSPCFHCAWRRRKAIFLAADRLGCNKVALAHHADDVAQTTLMNLANQGRLDTMWPRVAFFGGRFTVIRPLFFVPEKDLARLARVALFPPAPPPCAAAEATQRAFMARILEELETRQPHAKANLWRAVQRYGRQPTPEEEEREREL
ncbi:MAG: ATP-binding protein [Anaerolineae bacterium]